MIDHLLGRLQTVFPPGIIAVSGFGGAGKSTLAAQIGEHLHSPVISVDSFIKDKHLVGYHRWEIMDYERLEREVLAPFCSGATSIEFGHFDWSSNRIASRRVVRNAQRIVVEGVGLFRPALLGYFSLTVWVRCSLEEAIRRGKQRDREVYNQSQDENWDGLWRDNDEECYRLYQPELKADAIYDNRSEA